MSIATYDLASLTYDSATTDYDGGGLGLANMPVVGVFISFTDGPYVADPNWVEVTQYVRDINVKRGRGNDLQQFPSGSANLTLDNRTRIFDPFNTAGTYYGNLKPRRQIKIVGQWAGVTYPIFRGFIAGWPVGYSDGGKDSTVDIDCFDAMGLLATEKTASDPLYSYTKSLLPTDYWRCADDASSTVLLNDIRNNTMISAYAPNPKFTSVESLTTSIKTTAASLVQYATAIRATPTLTLTPSSLSISCWMKQNSTTQQSFEVWRGSIRMVAQMTSSGLVVRVWYATISAGTRYTTAAISTSTLDAHHICVAWDKDATTFKVYIDGIEMAITITSFADTKAYVDYESMQWGIFQEYSIYDRVLSASEVLSLYNYGALQIKESTTSRATRILSDSSFPIALRNITATPIAQVNDVTTNSTTLNELQIVNSSEGGELYVDRLGYLTLLDREYFGATRSAVSQMSFVDTGTGVYYDHAALNMAYDADQMRNSIEIQFSNGGSILNSDATSIAANGEAGDSRSTIIADLDTATALASRLVTIYKNPKLRIEPFVVKGQRNPSYDFPLLLSLELLDRFTFVRTPSTGSAVSQDMLLQSIEHRITPGTWETVVNGSARFTGWFIIGTSLLGGADVLL
jgi:hypothetical protein